jgi:hypothetical protein
MGRKKTHTPEEIVAKLRQVELLAAQGKAVAEAMRSIGITEQLRDELLDGEVFRTVREAQVLIERWRRHLQHHQAAQRARLPPTHARGGHAKTAAPPLRPGPAGAAQPSSAMLHENLARTTQ